MAGTGIARMANGCPAMNIEPWTVSFADDLGGWIKKWLRRQCNRLLCRHQVDTMEIEDMDLQAIREWILGNVDDPIHNISITIMMLQERFVVGGEFRFRRRSDAVAFRLRWC
jgi:hypothetical protein